MLGRNLIQAASGTAAEAETGWDISDLSFAGSPVNAYNADDDGLNFGRGLVIANNGTKMYATSVGNDAFGNFDSSIAEYTLTTAYDVATATLVSALEVEAEESNITDIDIKSDGTKIFIIGEGGDELNEYALSTAWTLSTATHTRAFDLTNEDSSPKAFAFKADGTSFYVSGHTNDKIFQYNLTTAWDLSTASYANKSFSYSTQRVNMSSMSFKPDGTKMILMQSDDFFEYNLSTAWDISTASYVQVNSDPLGPRASFSGYATWKSDGTKLFYHDANKTVIYQQSVSTAWDVSTIQEVAAYASSFADLTGDGIDNPTGLFFKPDGTKMYVIDGTDDTVNEFDLSTAWDIDTESFNQSYSFASVTGVSYGLHFKPDGTEMYVLSLDDDTVFQFALSTAWDVSTASTNGSFSIATQQANPRFLWFKPDGTKMYVSGATGDELNEYDLSTAWDVTSATFNQVESESDLEGAIVFKPDGLKLISVKESGATRNNISSYPLTTAWDISTIGTKTQLRFLYPYLSNTAGIYITEEGDKLFVCDRNLDGVVAFSM